MDYIRVESGLATITVVLPYGTASISQTVSDPSLSLGPQSTLSGAVILKNAKEQPIF